MDEKAIPTPTAAVTTSATNPLYTCPMHPEVRQDHPGPCPQCGIALEMKKAAAGPDVPAAVPGIAFLSGGQSAELATTRLNAMNVRFKSRAPWALAYSFGRAIQQPALKLWSGEEANIEAAHHALQHRASCNRAARRGEYDAAMEGGA